MMAMYTLGELKRILGLRTEAQVRNRVEAIRDLLSPHLRRGPNNRLLLDEEGLTLLRSLQDLCESGKTLKEAADALRSQSLQKRTFVDKPNEGLERLVEHLEEEVGHLRALLWGKVEEVWWRKWLFA